MTTHPDDNTDEHRDGALLDIDEAIAFLEKARDQIPTATVDMGEVESHTAMCRLFASKVVATLAGETVSAW